MATSSPFVKEVFGSVSVTSLCSLDRNMEVVLVAQMLDPVDDALGVAVGRLLDGQVLGAGADRPGSRRRVTVGQQAGRQEVDRRLTEARRDMRGLPGCE